MNTQDDRRRDFGREWLGPVFAEFARRLELYVAAATQDPPAVVLYCARGGFRLRAIHELWLQRMGLNSTTRHEDFMISRLLASKVALLHAPELVIGTLCSEFAAQSLRALASAFLPDTSAALVSAQLSTPRLTAAADAEGIAWLFFGDHSLARHLRMHAEEQHELLGDRLDALCPDPAPRLLVDSGLYGRTQLLLDATWPKAEWHGVYFARSNHCHQPAPHFKHATGLILEEDEFTYLVPEAAFLRYWHLIEAVLEPAIPSVRWLERRADESIGSNMDNVAWQDAVGDDGNPFFAGILEHLNELGPSDRQHSRARFRDAMRGLQQAILSPRISDIERMEVGARGRDFGRDGYNSVLHHNDENGWQARRRRIREALWSEGQVALELAPFGTLLLRQRRRLGLLIDALRFLGRRH
ncbi:MAG TPA: hypothetical protein PK752_03295 [Accumulibacter sp.]|uniref:hypothetical protein n=1 Tax=Accumulibacter sp. TaxID=2053492 RepID=UPI000EBFD140|nr:hypothetical protein [Accumulibacter sp.]HCZ15341.1 hypothetical protein [Accumulibacter sp.]HRD87274.1 hypothetical protein [Accumulibacter sp.]